MVWWLSAPHPPPFCPHLGQVCPRSTSAWDLSKPPLLPLTCKHSPPHPKSASSLTSCGHQPHPSLNLPPVPPPTQVPPPHHRGVRVLASALSPQRWGMQQGNLGSSITRGERFRVALPWEVLEGQQPPARQQSPGRAAGLAERVVLGTRQVLPPAVGWGWSVPDGEASVANPSFGRGAGQSGRVSDLKGCLQ